MNPSKCVALDSSMNTALGDVVQVMIDQLRHPYRKGIREYLAFLAICNQLRAEVIGLGPVP